ncbi:NTP transferase domain-containing protein [Novosphingobium mangrovi (ex Huang et al. 2023)]|uniref:NTP transferase domain-containing protein n=1 Tax=Novosphingobium mangrovi (ex Huang et al. 2023) TaxID=2976432 RepID=A0ABT2I3B3_9SPHN|nr:NTP transferase domain-containing protein [Novosphingobium mangrovi (ex Huang et al. 2023)]MCT2399087.1 NTP transferase domain-containing protein [Novosphingobium mangrovi (ex Huang et al. 2023)]
METHLSALPETSSALRLIVLAGQQGGAADPLAERFGKSHRSLIPLAGQPMIAHVLHTGLMHPNVASLAICIEKEAFAPLWDVLTRLPGRGTVALVEAREHLADSVRDAARGWEGPLIVTTADHALLSADAIDAVAGALGQADAVIALSPRDCVEAMHRAAPRRFLSLRDGDFAACDVYGIAGPSAVRAVEVFRGNGGFDRSGTRIRRAAGLLGLLLMRCRMLTLAAAAEFASRRLGLRLSAVVLPDGGQAIDVDDDHSYAVVRDLLDGRAAASVKVGQARDARRLAGTG